MYFTHLLHLSREVVYAARPQVPVGEVVAAGEEQVSGGEADEAVVQPSGSVLPVGEGLA